MAGFLQKVLPAKAAYALTRYKNARLTLWFWMFRQRFPKLANPPYKPWDQRLCSVPDGDLFRCVSAGKASVVTDHVRTFTESGINSGDRTDELRRVRCPTLVVHGDRDLMVGTNGGYATAAAISGASLVILPGMGHDFPPHLNVILISLIVGHVRSSQDAAVRQFE